MRKLFLLAALAACVSCSGKGGERPALAKKGLPAPEIYLPKLLNAPAKELRGWDSLRDKVVVLEFWATWCGPCTDYIPKLNALAERFRGRPVVFIHITDESEKDVAGFLKSARLEGWVAPEAGASVFKAFRVYGRPHTVLIGRDGAVAGFPRGELDAETLMALLAGHEAAPDPSPAVSTGTELAEFYIARSGERSGKAQYGPASLRASAMPLEYALEWLYGRVDRFDVKPSAEAVLAASYDIRMSLPLSRAAEKESFFLKGLDASLGLRVVRTEREEEVLVLRKAPGGLRNVRKVKEQGSAGLEGGALVVKGGDFGVLAHHLKAELSRPVLDETGLAGPYDYEFEPAGGDRAAAAEALRKKLGLDLSPGRRKIVVVEISGPKK